MAAHRLAAPQGCRGSPGWQSRSLVARPHPSSQPGSWITPVTDIRHFPGFREELRLGQDIVLWVGIAISKVHSQEGAWICGSGVCQIGSQATVRGKGDPGLMLGWVVRPAGAFMILSESVRKKQIPTTLWYNHVSKFSDFGRIFILMCSSFSQLKYVIDLDKIFCHYNLPKATLNVSQLFQLGTLFPVINTNVSGVITPKQLHK